MCSLGDPPEALISIDPLHPPFLAQLRCSAPVCHTELFDDRQLDFSKADYEGIKEALMFVDWSPLNNTSSIDHAVQYFSDTLIQLFPRFVPYRRPRQSPPWSNNRLRILKRNRAKSLRQYSNNRNPISKHKFNNASSEYKFYNRMLYSRYVLHTQKALKSHPKRFWSFVNEKRKECGLPSSMFLGNENSSSTQEICNLFAKLFASVFDNATPTQQQSDDALRDVPIGLISIGNLEFSTNDILAAIRKLKPSKTPGPDGIPSIALIKCADFLCSPLRLIFNLSLSQAVFPERWKKSVMFPVHKKGDKRNVSNYRGVTSLCAAAKLLEILVSTELLRVTKPYISQEQHGFFPGQIYRNQFSSIHLVMSYIYGPRVAS